MRKIVLLLVLVIGYNQNYAQLSFGLMAHWPMNGNLNDVGPSGINGTNFGATSTTNLANVAGTAMSFSNPTNTVAQYGTHPINATLNFSGSQNFSLDFTVFIPSTMTHALGVYDNNLNYSGYGCYIWNANGFIQLQFNYKNKSVGTTNGAIPGNNWYHITCVRDAGVMKVYINGVLNASITEGTIAPTYNFPARIGTMFFNGSAPPQYNGYNGKIDEIRIYNRVLSAAEMGATLPVKLSSFTAAKRNQDVLLQWQSEYEQNADYFNVQRSIDGKTFTTIATVKASGTTTAVSKYEFTDQQVTSRINTKTVYYRLESVDLDLHKSFSSINALAIDNRIIVMIYPNPVSTEALVTVNVNQTENLDCKIVDQSGRVVKQIQWKLQPGSSALKIDVSQLAKGSYVLQLQGETIHEIKQFVKQ